MRVVEFKPTILIIDDSIEDCEVYRRYLLGQNSKFEIASVHTAQSALDCFSSLQPDVILLDFFLPDADGLEFLSELRNQSDEIPPVIMLSGQGNEKIAVNAMKSGVQDYLPKSGLSPQTLRYAVNNALEQRKLQRLLTKNKQQQRLFTDTALRIRQSLEVQEIWDVAVN